MPTLYLTHQGSQLGFAAGRLTVRLRRKELFSAPAELVDQVVAIGGVQITARALAFLLDNGIETSFLTLHGRFRGRLQPPLSKNVALRKAQFARADDPDFCLAFARAIVSAKLTSQYYACLRWGRQAAASHARDAARSSAESVAHARSQSARAADLPSLLGFEGAGTRAYYAALRAVVAHKFPFERRTRRPPQDPISLLLGFGSALLQARVFAAVSQVGLDPFVGFYHAHKYGRPALVLDLMEEFRPVLADAVTAATVNLRVVRPEHFEQDSAGLVMCPEAAGAFAQVFDRRLTSVVRHPVVSARTTYARWIVVQARLLARWLLGESEGYPGFYVDR